MIKNQPTYKSVSSLAIRLTLLATLVPFFCCAQVLRYPSKHLVKSYYPDFGNYFSLYIANRVPYTDIYVVDPTGNRTKEFHGSYLIDYGTDTTTVDRGGFPGDSIAKSPNNRYTFTFRTGTNTWDAYSLPYTPAYVYNQDHSGIAANGIRQSGIIGTDILAQMILTLDYKNSRIYITADSSTHCTPKIMVKAGFTAATTEGYFSNDLSKLVWKSKYGIKEKNNNPYVPIFIGDESNKAKAIGSIDPGLDDKLYLAQDWSTYYTHCININKNYFDLLVKSGIKISVDTNSFAAIGTRSGVPDKLFKCNFAKKYIFSMLSIDGKSINPYSTDSITVFLKVKSKGAGNDGGITTLPFPAAQFGGTFLLDFDAVTFDPFKSLIWFRKNE